MEFSRPEYWNGDTSPSPVDLPRPGIKPESPELQAILYQLRYQGSPNLAKEPLKKTMWNRCLHDGGRAREGLGHLFSDPIPH